uniref:Nuclear pore complex NUP2/50/61 domain-containing protein n=1 Tax=Timema bartmani TaxID=61472 RepID=A0A7R9HYY8_9NEOP|nr:unnamed protein product [Timema bartmani]
MVENVSQCSGKPNDNTKTIAIQTPQPTLREQRTAGSLRIYGDQDLKQGSRRLHSLVYIVTQHVGQHDQEPHEQEPLREQEPTIQEPSREQEPTIQGLQEHKSLPSKGHQGNKRLPSRSLQESKSLPSKGLQESKSPPSTGLQEKVEEFKISLKSKMAKRIATSELNHDNWNQEEKSEEAGSFKKAAPEVMQQRIIKAAKRRAGHISEEVG